MCVTYHFVLSLFKLPEPIGVLRQCRIEPIFELIAKRIIFFVFKLVQQVSHSNARYHSEARYVQSIRQKVAITLL